MDAVTIMVIMDEVNRANVFSFNIYFLFFTGFTRYGSTSCATGTGCDSTRDGFNQASGLLWELIQWRDQRIYWYHDEPTYVHTYTHACIQLQKWLTLDSGCIQFVLQENQTTM